MEVEVAYSVIDGFVYLQDVFIGTAYSRIPLKPCGWALTGNFRLPAPVLLLRPLIPRRKHMEQDRIEGTSRRAALTRGLRATAGVAVVWLAGSRTHAESNKADKAAVQYTDAGNVPGKDCDDCVQFVPGATAKDSGTCRIVAGDISPHGHCLAFTPKPKT